VTHLGPEGALPEWQEPLPEHYGEYDESSPEIEPLPPPLHRPRLRTLQGVGVIRCAPYLLGFRNLPPTSASRRCFLASPMIPFRVQGLLIWGATKDTWITRCQVRNTIQIQASMDPLPALFFASALSFAEITSRLRDAEGEPSPYRTRTGSPTKSVLEPTDYLEGWLSEHPDAAEHQLLQLHTLGTGDQVLIELDGPFHQLVFWGLGAEA
jgi:hypothetical protein